MTAPTTKNAPEGRNPDKKNDNFGYSRLGVSYPIPRHEFLGNSKMQMNADNCFHFSSAFIRAICGYSYLFPD